jgi:hypothetical protein
VNRKCLAHHGWLPAHQLHEIYPGQIPGAQPEPGEPERACLDCIRAHGLLTIPPSSPAYIGRRDAAPIPPRPTGRPA